MIAALSPEPDIHIERVTEIAAPPEIVFESLLAQIGPESDMPDGTPMPMKIEPWPGGRWFRDLGDNAGHLWGHVQVIKPPKLLEISGPLFMSYPALNFVQYRLTAEGGTTRLKLVHQAIGLIPQDHREGVVEGWEYELKKIRESAERRAESR
jgi:uncharacterized protein YndB with AHSA1/START domain